MKPSRKSKKSLPVLELGSLQGADHKIDGLLKRLTTLPHFSNLPRSLLRDLKLTMIEAVANAVRHGGSESRSPCRVRLNPSVKKIEITVEDSGPGFNLAKASRPLPGDGEVTGRGMWILKNLMDKVDYRRGKPNRLRLVRRLARPKKVDAVLDLFDNLNQGLQRLKPLKQLHEQFLDFVVDLFNVERASLLVYDAESGKLKVGTSRGIPSKLVAKIQVTPGQGIAGYVFQTSRPLLVQNSRKLRKGTPLPRGKGYQTASFVSIPVIVSPTHIGEETIGVLNLTDKRDGTPFSQSEIQLLTVMAAQAASVFRIRDLIDTVKSHEALNKELEIVQEIQNRLIPRDFPKMAAFDIGGHCKLSSRGGGDYYDVVEVEGNLRVVVADVSGHHVGSAITMASFRSIFRSLVYDPHSPGSLLQALRWALHPDLLKLQQFISCWVVELKKSGTIRGSGAGHPPLLHYKSRSKQWQTYESTQLPLGLEDETEAQDIRIHLDKRDCLFLYTDGLFDPRMRETGFDKFRFCEIVESNLKLSAQELVDKIIAEVSPHQMSIRSPDDIALLAIRRN